MAEIARELSEYLDDMALNILMVEPGDLSVVGALLELTEQLVAEAGKQEGQGMILSMAKSFNAALQKIIMGDLPDSAENFDRLGQCVVQMQEVARKGGEVDEAANRLFRENMTAVGFAVEEQAGPPSEAEPAAAQSPAAPPAPEPAAPSASAKAEKGGAVDLDFLQDKDLLAGFVAESFEHLESIEVNILDLEQDPGNSDIINNIFRTFHTIKGVSGFLNLKKINELSHITENLLDDVRNGKREMDSDVIDVVLGVGDYLREMVQNVKDVLEKGPDVYRDYGISQFVERVKAVQSGQGEAAPAVLQLDEEDEESSSAEAEADVPPAVAPQGRSSAAAQPAAGSQPAAARANGPAARSRIGESIKVDIDKLDGLVNAVGELVIMQSLVRQNPLVSRLADPKLNRDFSQLARITTELQRTAMAMRMVPIRQTFQKMTRLVRDLSKKTGKTVDLIMVGEETEVDRNMVDSIYDPLVHMIRNSVDHGVQSPDAREKVGKPRTGSVYLRAYQKGGNIVIEIEDDGEGLNTPKIRKKALERGLISEGDNLTDHDIQNLVFLPGFSTADKITDVSGRGVGMDVVKKAVEKLRGKVDVSSEAGKGSIFTIRLPLTLAIIDGIIVRIGMERYIIPTIAIQESIRPKREEYNTVYGKGEALMIRDRLVPIIRLYEIFGVEPTYTDPCEALVVVVENEGVQRALMVDELLGKQEVVIKSLGGYLKDTKGVAGGTILGDGRVGLILDLASLLAIERSSAEAAATAEGEMF
ncbi:MAG: chemotaxis protein CheA [Desulfobulbaceae bacterium]|nr:chemotaxis protein CheA [Desulfobulbaceae bacterium]